MPPVPLRRTRYFSPESVAENFFGASLSTSPAPLGSLGKATSLASSALMATFASKRKEPSTTPHSNLTFIVHSLIDGLHRRTKTQPDSKGHAKWGQRALPSTTKGSGGVSRPKSSKI